jgi:nucleotide-binding universal stress UspA family protein
MTDVVVLCADGSDLSTRALVAGLDVLAPDLVPIVVTVVEPSDQMLVTGSGFAGGTMSPEEFDAQDRALVAEGERVAQEAAAAVGHGDAETVVLRGDPAIALCDLATERGARAMVIGSRGRGGFKRALLGSVSDAVARNAPCPVIITHAPDEP